MPIGGLGAADLIEEWANRYLGAAVYRVRSVEVTGKIALHLARFRDHFADTHGHERLSAVVRREVVAWREHLASSTESPDVQGLEWLLPP